MSFEIRNVGANEIPIGTQNTLHAYQLVSKGVSAQPDQWKSYVQAEQQGEPNWFQKVVDAICAFFRMLFCCGKATVTTSPATPEGSVSSSATETKQTPAPAEAGPAAGAAPPNAPPSGAAVRTSAATATSALDAQLLPDTLPVTFVDHSQLRRDDLKHFCLDEQIDRAFQGKSAQELKAFFQTVSPGWEFVNCIQAINSRPDRKELFRDLIHAVLTKYWSQQETLKQYIGFDSYRDGKPESPRSKAMLACVHAYICYALEKPLGACAALLALLWKINDLFGAVVLWKNPPFLDTLSPLERDMFMLWAKDNGQTAPIGQRTPFYEILLKRENQEQST